MVAFEVPAYFINLISFWSPLHPKYMLCNPWDWQPFSEYIHALQDSGPLLKLYPLRGTLNLSLLYLLIQERSFSRSRNEFWLV